MKQKITTTDQKRIFHFSDVSAAFLVFLLALPLSLGIAKASGFPASMGVLTAIVGGVFTLFFKISELSIKGPAAGLITICAAAVAEFGGGVVGWQIVCAVIVVMAVLQMCLGLFKLGGLSDFFPQTAVRGMLAAIGIIIIAKQIPVLLGVSPEIYAEKSVAELLINIPSFITLSNLKVALIGVFGLILLFTVPKLRIPFVHKIPTPLLVLLLAIPLAILWDFKTEQPAYVLVIIGDFWGSLAINTDFSSIATFPFWKYVIMFLFVSSLESILTVKAVDSLDPDKKESNYNGDLIGQGAGNIVSGMLGGLPMISEVVRSSANISYGARSKWSNFFHGIFLLLAMLFIIPIIELIPNTALAAMLIHAGYKLTAPKEFIHIKRVGTEQLLIFIVTILVTLLGDLLLGIFSGIAVKFLIHLYHGVQLKNFFEVRLILKEKNKQTILKVSDAAVFSNIISFRKKIAKLFLADSLIIDLSSASFLDHSFMSFLSRLQKSKKEKGCSIEIIGLDKHKAFSDHPLATRKLPIGDM